MSITSRLPTRLDELGREPVECAGRKGSEGRRRLTCQKPRCSSACSPARWTYLAPTSCFWSSTSVSIWTRRGLTLSFNGKRQAQHPVSVGGGEFLEVEELRNDQRLLVACDALSLPSLETSARMVRLLPATSSATSLGSMPGSGTSTRQPSSAGFTWNDGEDDTTA